MNQVSKNNIVENIAELSKYQFDFRTILKQMVKGRWIYATLAVILGVAVLIRLGIWQLDRLEARKAFNAHVYQQKVLPVLNLNDGYEKNQLQNMEYRGVEVSGTYDHSQQIALRNQYWQNQSGFHLLTPLMIKGSGSSEMVLIDRGWIPSSEYAAGNLGQFDEPGDVQVEGIVRKSRDNADFGVTKNDSVGSQSNPTKAWNFVNIESIQKQIDSPILPIYIQQSPEPTRSDMPYRFQPELELTEGPHFGYAIQWFTFAAILGLGYPIFVSRHLRRN
jgi:surfeit locus 1 family protein